MQWLLYPIMQGSGLTWLFPFEDGHPPIGWHDAAAYLVLPVLLIVSQYFSQKIVSPKTDDPQQKQTQAILQFIPLMIGECPCCRSTWWLSLLLSCLYRAAMRSYGLVPGSWWLSAHVHVPLCRKQLGSAVSQSRRLC